MAQNHIETTFTLESLRGPLNPSPLTDQEKYLHDLCTKYRYYFVQYNANDGAVLMPSMFSDDFRDDITRIVTLIDSTNNQFECLVEKINLDIYLTRGWAALRDFYGIRLGAWLMLLYLGAGKFGVTIHDRFHELLITPMFIPPMKFSIDMFTIPPYFVSDLPASIDALSYSHDGAFFNVAHEKVLTYDDVTSGFLVLPYDGFGEYAFEDDITRTKLVDDCGNAWICSLTYGALPFKHIKVGEEWSKMVAARRLTVGEFIRVGSQANGQNRNIYFILGNDE